MEDSQQYFSSVQKFVTFDLGLTLLPVRGQNEASQLIAQMVNHKHKPDQKLTFVWLKRQGTQYMHASCLKALFKFKICAACM